MSTDAGSPPEVLLGTVALEPNRWGMVDRSGAATIDVAALAPRMAQAGFDGLELWDRHLTQASPAEGEALVRGPLPLTIFNSYIGFDDADPSDRAAVARWVAQAGSRAVKFNVGNDPAAEGRYADRIAAWLDAMPPHVVLLCECHAGISVAEDPAVAARILGAAGDADRVQAIVHTHEDVDHLRERFDAYGERITHVHVNFLDVRGGGAPRLQDVRDELATKVALLHQLGFRGSWTIEFVHGVLTDEDRPEPLLTQATHDLAVLRAVLEEHAR
jgi:sugar phosphate isomerase/epimerase